MDRDSRRLSHNKGNKIVTQVSAPLSSDGDDGDQKIVGSTLYTKSEGKWIGFKSTDTSVGQIGKWIDMDFLNNWLNYSGSYMQAGYLLDEIGWVHLRGVIQNYHVSDIHNTNEVVCKLPPLYRPHKRIYCNVLYDGNNSRRFVIYNTGNIAFPESDSIAGGSSKWSTLDNISWWVGKERLRQL